MAGACRRRRSGRSAAAVRRQLRARPRAGSTAGWTSGADDVRRDFADLAGLGLDHVRIFPIWPWIQPNRGTIRDQRRSTTCCAPDRLAAEFGLDVVGRPDPGAPVQLRLPADLDAHLAPAQCVRPTRPSATGSRVRRARWPGGRHAAERLRGHARATRSTTSTRPTPSRRRLARTLGRRAARRDPRRRHRSCCASTRCTTRRSTCPSTRSAPPTRPTWAT